MLAIGAVAASIFGGCALTDSDDGVTRTVSALEVDARPSPLARSEIPAERLDAYVEAGRELGLDWAVIAAVSRIETDHGSGGVAAPIEDALGIGYALQSSGAPGSYRAALTARGGAAFARRAIRIADSYRGPATGGVDPPDEAGAFDPPVDGAVRAGFGMLYGRPHLGIDFDARAATDVRAAASGVVTDVGSAPAYGRYVCLLHRFPEGLLDREDLTSCYGYLGATEREPGDVVRRGETVGLSGCSGACISPRVHFILRLGARPDSLPVDPAPYLADDARGGA